MPADQAALAVELVDDVVAVPHELDLLVHGAGRGEGALGGAASERVVFERDPHAVGALDLAEHAVAVPAIVPVAVGP